MHQSSNDSLSSKHQAEALRLLHTVGMIAAIKYIRGVANLSLADAKRQVSLLRNRRKDNTGANFSPNTQPMMPTLRPSIRGRERWIACPLISVGLCFLTAGAALWYQQQVKIAESTRISARVQSVDGRGTPTFEYAWKGDEQIWTSYLEFETRGVSGPSQSYQVGDKAQIYVNINQPNHPLVDDFLHRWFSVSLFSAMVFLFVTIPTLVLWLTSRH